jgi:hypothetical protein
MFLQSVDLPSSIRALFKLIWWKRRFALISGKSSDIVSEVVRDLRRRKPGIASLAYFDAGLADRHAKHAKTPSERAGYAAVTDFDKVISTWVRTGVWSRYAGPEPGMGRCRAPAELLAKHGIAAVTGDKRFARRVRTFRGQADPCRSSRDVSDASLISGRQYPWSPYCSVGPAVGLKLPSCLDRGRIRILQNCGS